MGWITKKNRDKIMTDAIIKVINKFPLCGFRCCKHLITMLVVSLIFIIFYQFYMDGVNYTQWDIMLITEVAIFVVALRILETLPTRFNNTFSRLETRKILNLTKEEKEEVIKQLDSQGELVARIVAVLLALAILLSFVDVLIKKFEYDTLLLSIAEVFGAYIAGEYIGRMINYGFLGRLLLKNNLKINIDPWHVDNVGGLKPLGDFFYFQAKIVAIPAVFLALWWFMFPFWPRDYSHWLDSYAWLMAGAMILVFITYMIPQWSFHRLMLKSKKEWRAVSDKMSHDITQLRHYLDNCKNNDEKKINLSLIAEKTKRYWDIENMTTWPVDISTGRKFKLNNLILLLPLFGDIFNLNDEWVSAINTIKNIIFPVSL